jgi:osmotically-inducible protein OsmY
MKTDTALQQDVLAELLWEPAIDAARVGVEAEQGVVTLSGRVDTFAEKWAAERAAQRVSGVQALAIKIDVALRGSSERSDADIARDAMNALMSLTCLQADSVTVMVEGGAITLGGQVEWQYQRAAAAACVRHLRGVTGVYDQIGLKPVVSTFEVKTDIEAALKRRMEADANQISIAVHKDQVTLQGVVHSWDERMLVVNSAWGTRGVRSVIDEMTLAA